jgi:hypothetical protein
MTIDERRQRLRRRLEEVLGPEEAGTLMEDLGRTPLGVEDLRLELRTLEERIGHRFDLLEERTGRKLSDLKSELTKTLVRSFVITNSAMVLAVATLAFGAARLA